MPTVIWLLGFLGLLATCSADSDNLLGRFKRASRVKRIIGGSDIEKGEWPHLCHLYGKIPSSRIWGIPTSYRTIYCGCTIIDKEWVVTAAHCFTTQEGYNKEVRKNIKTPKYWHIKAGEVEREHSLWDKFRSLFGDAFGVSDLQIYKEHAVSIHQHPEYTGKSSSLWEHDIAVVKVEKEMPLHATGRAMDKVTLPDKDTSDNWPAVHSNCTTKGWGCTYPGGPLTQNAKAVVLPTRNNSYCGKVYGQSIGKTRICSGPDPDFAFDFETKGICPGDSGGPLVCMGDNGIWMLAGIASFTSSALASYGRSMNDYERVQNIADVKVQPLLAPSVFTRVPDYIDFIRKYIGQS